MRLETQCHQGFGGFAADGLFIRQKVILDELLCQSATALHDTAGAEVCPERAHHATRVDTRVLVEAPVLDQFDP
jgi:hypothetical protein